MKLAAEAERDNRDAARDDIRFARLGEQWPDAIVRQRRLEGRACLTINRLPQIAPVIGDLVAKHLDWPGADEIAKRLRSMQPTDAQSEIPSQIKKLLADGQKLIQQPQAENAKLKTDTPLAAKKLKIEQFRAETERLAAMAEARQARAGVAKPNGAAMPGQV